SLSRVAAAAQVGAYCGEDWICPMSFARSLRESLCPRLPATPEACDNSRRLEALAPPCSVRKSIRSRRVGRIQTTHPRCGPLTRNTQVMLGALFVSTFFENLGKELYSAKGYAGLIRYYIQYGHAPAVWKQVMGLMAANSAIAGPGQAVLEASLGVFLILGL